MSALIRLDPEAKKGQKYSGLLNTAWTRVEIRVREGHNGPVDPSNPPPLEVKMTHFNHKEHLDTLKDFPHTHVEVDGARAEAKAFFGGETTVQA
ncbi:hypothetical protein NLJ89_g12385 [Agrocybe chaxingu]|uniref:Uncharacterized protein n=1 Tax=Agrocybe chaxingu TaxID=84603 RepID=A0A9W8MQP3_9AGAR|nr:hypothetical protein NLJ89_g12385 [Agrocybe chaxingu]